MADQLTEASELGAALSAPQFLLVKHSPVCPISARAFEHYERFAAVFVEVPTAWIDVIGEKSLSDRVADATEISHESPQALILRDGEVVWNASHTSITKDALADAWASCFGE